jgi:heme exporter protein CcmD
MIPDFGERAVFIWTSYGIVALVVSALIAWLVLDGRRQAARLARLEADLGRDGGRG